MNLIGRMSLPFAAIFMMLGLTGCPVTLKTIVLRPYSLQTSYQYWYNQSWECSVPLPGQGFFLNGLGPAQLGNGEIYSGFEDIFDQGAQPFPCDEEQQLQYRSDIQFDLRQFDTVVDATLSLNVDKSETQTGGDPQIPAQSNATTLGMSTGTRDDGNGPYYWDFDESTQFLSCGELIQPNCQQDVSWQVREWLTPTAPGNVQHPNDGFIVAGPLLGPPNGGPPQDNNASLTWYSGPTLTIIYNPAQNPRAPQ